VEGRRLRGEGHSPPIGVIRSLKRGADDWLRVEG